MIDGLYEQYKLELIDKLEKIAIENKESPEAQIQYRKRIDAILQLVENLYVVMRNDSKQISKHIETLQKDIELGKEALEKTSRCDYLDIKGDNFFEKIDRYFSERSKATRIIVPLFSGLTAMVILAVCSFMVNTILTTQKIVIETRSEIKIMSTLMNSKHEQYEEKFKALERRLVYK